MVKEWRILNLGAGVQSTCVALMGAQNWYYWSCSEPLPYPPVGLIECAIFADTGDEPRAVYAHLDWLEAQVKQWFPILRRSRGNLGDSLKYGLAISTGEMRRVASIPAFTAPINGQPGGTTWRQCTSEFKVEVINAAIRYELLGLSPGDRLKAGMEVHQLMGLSYDEPGRIARVKGRFTQENWTVSFPLFEMEQTRRGCKAWLKKQNIPHEVPRSACVYCPYHSDSEWRAIKEVPEDWARVIEVDRWLREKDSICTRVLHDELYLHRSCQPIDQVDFRPEDERTGQLSFNLECEGMCGV